MIFILMQIKLILTAKVFHLASFWKWEFLELGNALWLYEELRYVVFWRIPAGCNFSRQVIKVIDGEKFKVNIRDQQSI